MYCSMAENMNNVENECVALIFFGKVPRRWRAQTILISLVLVATLHTTDLNINEVANQVR